MALTWKQLIQKAKSEIREMTTENLHQLMKNGNPAVIIDVREREEFLKGHLPGAVFIPRGFLELRIESTAPDHSQLVCLYCGAGNRSALAARSLQEMGYSNVFALAGGLTQWRKEERPVETLRERDIDPLI